MTKASEVKALYDEFRAAKAELVRIDKGEWPPPPAVVEAQRKCERASKAFYAAEDANPDWMEDEAWIPTSVTK